MATFLYSFGTSCAGYVHRRWIEKLPDYRTHAMICTAIWTFVGFVSALTAFFSEVFLIRNQFSKSFGAGFRLTLAILVIFAPFLFFTVRALWEFIGEARGEMIEER